MEKVCFRFDVTDIMVRLFFFFRYWLFGQKVQNISANGNDASIPSTKGWFPRKCAVETVDFHNVMLQNCEKEKTN